jgi:hypothetical protein
VVKFISTFLPKPYFLSDDDVKSEMDEDSNDDVPLMRHIDKKLKKPTSPKEQLNGTLTPSKITSKQTGIFLTGQIGPLSCLIPSSIGVATCPLSPFSHQLAMPN